MILKATPQVGVTEALSFVNFEEDNAGKLASTFENVNAAQIDKVNGADDSTNRDIYITNTGAADTGAISATITASGENADYLKVAIFVDGKFVAIWDNDADKANVAAAGHEDAIVGAEKATILGTAFDTTNATIKLADALTKYDGTDKSIRVSLYAWLDGVDMTNANTGATAAFDIVFTAA